MNTPIVKLPCTDYKLQKPFKNVPAVRPHTAEKRELLHVANHRHHLYPHSPLLAVLHGTVDGVASATNDTTLSPATQQTFDGLHTSQAAGHVERRLPVVVQLIHPRAQPRAQDLNEERM